MEGPETCGPRSPRVARYITQLSTVVYVPFFASLSGPAIVSNLRSEPLVEARAAGARSACQMSRLVPCYATHAAALWEKRGWIPKNGGVRGQFQQSKAITVDYMCL